MIRLQLQLTSTMRVTIVIFLIDIHQFEKQNCCACLSLKLPARLVCVISRAIRKKRVSSSARTREPAGSVSSCRRSLFPNRGLETAEFQFVARTLMIILSTRINKDLFLEVCRAPAEDTGASNQRRLLGQLDASFRSFALPSATGSVTIGRVPVRQPAAINSLCAVFVRSYFFFFFLLKCLGESNRRGPRRRSPDLARPRGANSV